MIINVTTTPTLMELKSKMEPLWFMYYILLIGIGVYAVYYRKKLTKAISFMIRNSGKAVICIIIQIWEPTLKSAERSINSHGLSRNTWV